MKLLEIVQALEVLKNHERLEWIIAFLNERKIRYTIQDYHSGVNVFTKPKKKPYIGLSSHFDVVPNSPGANDNASAIAVCLEVLRKYEQVELDHLGLQVFFFDEEERGLQGSQAFVEEYSLNQLIGLINLELVGMGNQFALWPVSEQGFGRVLTYFERVAKQNKIKTNRFDRIVTNTADHVSFKKAGIEDVFTITCVTDQDLAVAEHYYKALEFEVDVATLKGILAKAPLFRNYHQATDLAEFLSEETLQMTADSVWETIYNLDKRWNI